MTLLFILTAVALVETCFRWGLRRELKKRGLLALSLLCSVSVEGATNTSPSALLGDVQNTCNSSSDGDQVNIPGQTVSWTGTLNPGKNLILNFQGTIITDAVSQVTGSTILRWTLNSGGNEAAIVGATWCGISGQSSPDVGLFVIDGTCFKWRVCTNTFISINNRSIQEHGWIYGVIDHNFWINSSFQQFIEVWHDGYGGGQFGDISWTDPDFEGTTNGLYIESNTFLQTGPNMNQIVDMMGGARVYFRVNIGSNCVATTHGTESTGRQRSVRLFEPYTNHFYLNAAAGVGNATSGIWRGGSGVSFGNTYTYFGPNPGANWFGPNLVCYREISQFPFNGPPPSAGWGGATGTNLYDINFAGNPLDSGTHNGANGAQVLTDTTKNWTPNGWTSNMLFNASSGLASRITGNTATTITYDTSGPTVSGGTLLTFNSGDVYRVMSVYPALDQPGMGQQTIAFNSGSSPATPVQFPSELSDPIYSSGNTLNGSPGMDVGSSYPSIKLGRDYFNAPKLGWTALAFPHPLVTGGGIPAKTWFVSPFGSGAKNGTSYGNSWSNLSSVVWGGLGVNSGDTVYVTGTHALTMQQLAFSLGQITPVSGFTLRGDYPGDPGTIFCGAIWALPSRTNFFGPDANGVYWTTNVYNDANLATALTFNWEVDGTNIIRLHETNVFSWPGNLGTFAYSQPDNNHHTNFVKMSYNGPPTNNLAFQQYGWYFNITGQSNITFAGLRIIGSLFQNLGNLTASHITFTNCTLSDEVLPFIQGTNDYWTIVGCDISYCQNGGVYLYNQGDSTIGAKHTTIIGNTIHDIDVTNFTRYTGGDGHGIGVRATASDVNIISNTVYRTESAIECFGGVQSNFTIAYNFAHDTHAGNTDGGGISLTGSGIKTNFAIYGNILLNLCTNCPQTYQGLGISGGMDTTSFITVYNNTIENAESGLYSVPGTFNAKLENNIVVNPRNFSVFINSASASASAVSDYNLYSPNGPFLYPSAFTHDVHSVAANPQFINSPQKVPNDFRISASSPAATAGTPVGIVNDFFAFPYQNPPSIGAFTVGTNAPPISLFQILGPMIINGRAIFN